MLACEPYFSALIEEAPLTLRKDKLFIRQLDVSRGAPLSNPVFLLRVKWGKLVQGYLKRKNRWMSLYEVVQFIRRYDFVFQRRLLATFDPARVMLLKHLEDQVDAPGPNKLKVAVVSGSDEEPELTVLRSALKRALSVDFLNFSENPDRFDLTLVWEGPEWEDQQNYYDIVLCEQVLEHVIDPKTAVKNLGSLLNERGFLHISTPAINNRHGSPDFYYAGFSPESLGHYVEAAGMSIDHCYVWDSKKGARMYATTDWSPLAVSGPVVFLLMVVGLKPIDLRLPWSMLLRRFRHSFTYPFQELFPLKKAQCPVAISVIARRNNPQLRVRQPNLQ